MRMSEATMNESESVTRLGRQAHRDPSPGQKAALPALLIRGVGPYLCAP
jgi:hypothetical protein